MTIAASDRATVSLTLPTGWIEIDLRTADMLPELERAMAVPAASHDAAVALLAPLALNLHRAAVESDVVICGFLAHALDVDGAAETIVLAANVLLAFSPPLADLASAAAALGGEVEPVDLPSGPAVLATGQVEITDERWEGTVPARTRRYLVPVPGTDRIAVLAFQTPNLDLADQFDDVFAAIAESLAFDLPPIETEGDPS